MPFQYSENGESKLELVKVRLCLDCAEKLFFHSINSKRGQGAGAVKSKTESRSKQATTATGSLGGKQDQSLENVEERRRGDSSAGDEARTSEKKRKLETS